MPTLKAINYTKKLYKGSYGRISNKQSKFNFAKRTPQKSDPELELDQIAIEAAKIEKFSTSEIDSEYDISIKREKKRKSRVKTPEDIPLICKTPVKLETPTSSPVKVKSPRKLSVTAMKKDSPKKPRSRRSTITSSCSEGQTSPKRNLKIKMEAFSEEPKESRVKKRGLKSPEETIIKKLKMDLTDKAIKTKSNTRFRNRSDDQSVSNLSVESYATSIGESTRSSRRM